MNTVYRLTYRFLMMQLAFIRQSVDTRLIDIRRKNNEGFMLAIVNSCALIGLDGEIVEVQVDYSGGALPSFQIVGLPDAVQESWVRVRGTIQNSSLSFQNEQFSKALQSILPKLYQ